MPLFQQPPQGAAKLLFPVEDICKASGMLALLADKNGEAERRIQLGCPDGLKAIDSRPMQFLLQFESWQAERWTVQLTEGRSYVRNVVPAIRGTGSRCGPQAHW